MELFFLFLLLVVMAGALASGFPVAFALPGSAILTIGLAALAGYLFAGDASAYFSQGGPIDWLTAGVTNFRGVYWEVERDTLIAIPLFVFMGIMLQRSRIAEDLLVTMAQLFGPVRGGLGMSVVFVGALLAATTGIVGATVVAMGLISLPAMLRNNYSHPLATGTIAASGTLGQIIPPSIVLIILADQLAGAVDQASNARKALYKATTGELAMPSEFGVASTSAGEMFLGAFVPGLILVVVYMVFIAVFALVRPKAAPSVPYDGKYDLRFAGRVALALVPPLALIFVVLGSIIMGIATVNQAGAIGAVGAIIMAGYRLREGHRRAYWPATLAVVSIAAIITITRIHPINIKNLATNADVVWLLIALVAVAAFLTALIWSGWRTLKIEDTLRGVMVETAKTTSLVFIILLGAAMLTAAFRAFGGEELVREFLTSLPGGFWAQFIIVMAVIFVLGFFLDFIEIAVVVVPIVAPILLLDPSANITAVWLGVMIGLNIQTSFLTPPFGFALFYLRGVAPAVVKTVSMYKGVVPFIALQLLALAVVGVFPPLVNYLPTRMSLLGETAPPPLNPRLQYCIEGYVFEAFKTNGDEIRGAIKTARTLDASYLPKKTRSKLEGSFGKAESIFARLDDISRAETALNAQADAYRPRHARVRAIQSDIAKIDLELKDLDRELDRLERNGTDAARLKASKGRAGVLKAERARLTESIPKDWEAGHKAFRELQKADSKARRAYRRTTDDAYGPVMKLIAAIDDTGALAELESEMQGLQQMNAGTDAEQAVARISEVRKRVGKIEGTRAIASQLTKARREIKRKTPQWEKAKMALGKAVQALQDDLSWRQRGAKELLPGLRMYERTIRDTIGLRQQPRLPREQALAIAGCNSVHRDISLSF
ncbi:MAG: TRAP transporter large permease subunit [Methyloligellaceae bacterium]